MTMMEVKKYCSRLIHDYWDGKISLAQLESGCVELLQKLTEVQLKLYN